MLDAHDAKLLRQVFHLYLLFALLALPNMTQAGGADASAPIMASDDFVDLPRLDGAGEPGYPNYQRFGSPTGSAEMVGPGVFFLSDREY